jgi:hypothetical protein
LAVVEGLSVFRRKVIITLKAGPAQHVIERKTGKTVEKYPQANTL